MTKYVLLAFFIATIVSCNDGVNKKLPPKESTNDKISLEGLKPFQNPTKKNNSHLPRLFSTGELLYMSWVTSEDDTDYLNFSVYDGVNWKETETITQGKDWFTNWADFPVIAANERGDILTSFLQKSADGTYTYDVKLNHFNAKTKKWTKNIILHDDGTQSEHGFVSMRPYVANSFLVTWLDGRETVNKGHGEGEMTLRAALVFEDTTIDYDTLLDKRVCDCCQTASAIGPDDKILVAYRDRSEDEIRDISITQWTKENGWNESKTVGADNWKIAGCPVNGPSIDSYEHSVGTAWFTAAGGEGKINVSLISNEKENSYRIDNGNATGRVDIEMISETQALVLWMEPNGDNNIIVLAEISFAEGKTKELVVTEISPERSSGFPQLEVMGGKAYVAWTEVANGKKNVLTTSIDLARAFYANPTLNTKP